MNVSIELTLSPLTADYEGHIVDFIKRLRASQFTVLENPLSTQIFGNYTELMPFLTEEIKRSFSNVEAVVLQMKVVKTDRSTYEPHF
jgi:uncharacterized protein YqgV (UPF0045/DUF77 family)